MSAATLIVTSNCPCCEEYIDHDQDDRSVTCPACDTRSRVVVDRRSGLADTYLIPLAVWKTTPRKDEDDGEDDE